MTWDAWTEIVIERKTNRLKVQRTVVKMKHKYTSAALHGWYTAVHEVKTNRLKVTRALKRLQNRIIAERIVF